MADVIKAQSNLGHTQTSADFIQEPEKPHHKLHQSFNHEQPHRLPLGEVKGMYTTLDTRHSRPPRFNLSHAQQLTSATNKPVSSLDSNEATLHHRANGKSDEAEVAPSGKC
jgi:hypothetical protein